MKQLLTLLLAYASVGLTSAQRRLVQGLPRLTFQPDFVQYSGYLNTIGNDSLFYWLVEASAVPASQAPLMLWLNGGPGCSSVGGLLMTNGPFLANDRVELVRNEFAWNKELNVLYVDSPVGTGLSNYAQLNSSLLNDNRTALANTRALLHFYQLFPEYSGRTLYLAGESYAGIYLPLLAVEILKLKQYPRLINLKAISIGNGLLVPVNDSVLKDSRTEYELVMGLNFSPNATEKFQHVTPVNSYNCAAPCHRNPSSDIYPCLNSTSLVAYLNDKEVRRALGVRSSSPEYVICQHQAIFKQYESIRRHVLPELEYLVGMNISIMLYHGHLDYLIPARVTQILLANLSDAVQPDVIESDLWVYCRRAFNSIVPQIGGVHRSYGGGRLVYRTVVGAGHSVATDLPEAGYQLLMDLLRDGNEWNCADLPGEASEVLEAKLATLTLALALTLATATLWMH